jgi:ABC-type transport system involved in cytochrome bd biosynthesis fused ATPase/permease subunit
MDQLRGFYTLRTLPNWALALTGVLGTVVGFSIFILGAGLLLFLVPVVIITGLIIRWRLRHLARKAYEQSRAEGPPVIDGEFKVMDERRGKLRIFH